MMNIYMNIIDICIYIYIDREREYYIHGTIYIFYIYIFIIYFYCLFCIFQEIYYNGSKSIVPWVVLM